MKDTIHRHTPRRDVGRILLMIVAVSVPAALTLSTVDDPQRRLMIDGASTRLGYTVSLSLFLVPVLVAFARHYRYLSHRVNRLAFCGSVGVVTLLGTFLDLAFGYHFFTFPNREATLGIRIPAWSFTDWHWIPSYLPIEEFAFYILGALFMLGVYVWADELWMKDYQPDAVVLHARSLERLVDFHLSSVLVALGAVGAGWAARKFWLMPDQPGFPSYFAFLCCLALLPTVVFLRSVAALINWRAFSLTLTALLLISLIWEATLGVPYGWWRYREDAMLGVFIDAWGGLPIEAVLLWLVAAWGSVVAYEFQRVYLHRRSHHGDDGSTD